ncbi:MAG: bifunctional nuclease domain-containing protein [Prevotella sp.]|nr:bifunctional nuclease domain-containing protein [Prevotella sp.]
MSLVLLKFKGVSEIVGNEALGLLVLTTEDETRQLSIVCERNMLLQFGLRMSPFPDTSILLPEVLWQIISDHTDLAFQVQILDLIGGQYKTFLHNMALQQYIPMRASDAILLAEIGNIPIYIDDKLLRRQSVPYDKNAPGVSVPVNVITTEMLKAALEKAIREENYEQASQLRDELKRREQAEREGDKP